MKRILILFLAVFAISTGCFAESAANAETSTNSSNELLTSDQQSQSLRGFKMFVETGFLWNVYSGDSNKHMRDGYMPNLLPVTASFGYQINDIIYVGGGTGMHLYTTSARTYLEVPFFINARVNFLRGRKVTPFGDVKFGATFGSDCGFFGDFGIGVRLALKNRHAMFLACQYEALVNYACLTDVTWDASALGLKIGFEF